MQLNIHDSTLKRIGFINNDLPDALHYFNDNWHRYLAEGTSTFDFSVNKVNPDYALLTLQSYISFSYDDEDYLFNIINIQQDHSTMQIQCENLNLELISEEVGAYSNTKRHSIVWYLRNAAKITDNVLEIGNNPFSTIDEDISNPILSFDSTETKLARIISICNSFKAEFQFKTNLKDDGTLQNITLDLYQTGGVGQLRKDVTLYYGKNIDGITSTGDRTSTFFNSTTVTDSNNKYNWLSIEGKYYNSDGQLEFYKDAGSNTAYAPLSRDMFPSQILSTSSDQYTNKNIQTSASSNDDLWDYAVSQFKLYAYPQMTYEVVVSVNAVTSALGNDKKLNIGDTIIVQDSTFDKSDGGLILSARVSEQEISFTNPLNNKITFTNFVKLKSEISADLYGRMKDLVDQNTPYRAELETTNGVQFKNSAGSTTLTARIYFGSDDKETIADSYEWSKDGTVVANAQTITVDASGVADKAVYSFKATVAGKVVASQSVTITNVDDGTNGRSVTNVSQKWRLTTTTAAPTQAWSDAGWLTTQPTTTATNKYLWSITRTTFNLAPLTQDVIEQKAVYGDKGDKGDTGNDGRAGKDGVGINSTTITYAISSSGTDKPNNGWTSQVPTLVKGQYLWTKTVWTYSDTTSETGYTVTYIAKDGNNGNDGIAGKDGTGIKTTTITYAGSTSGTIAPNNGWTAQVPTVPAGQYLWTKTVWTYTDNSFEIGYSVAMMGLKGERGKQIFKSNWEDTPNSSYHNWFDLSPAVSVDNPPKIGDTVITPSGNILQIDTVNVGGGGGGTFGVGDILGNIQGPSGRDGLAGKDGKGIKATAITYQASTNGTTAPTGTWSASVPPVAKGSFLWTRTIWTYTDNATETGYAVAYMGTNGNNGNDGIAGKDGVGIKTTTITYAGSTSGTTVPNSGWTSTVPTVAAGSYLWTKTVWAYTDNTIETGYSVGKMGNTGPAGPAGSDGNPGKIVSDTEPTTKFKGLAWKYSGAVDMTLGDSTKILAGTEYYWDGSAWALYEINAHNINGDNLSVSNGTFKDGKIESIWGGNGVNGTTTIEGRHLQIYSSDSTTNTENTVALDNLQGYAQVYTDHNTGRTITVQASFQGFFVSDSTGLYVRVTPNGISTSSDNSYNSFKIGAGITINLERRGDIVEATLSGSINSPLSSNTKFVVGTIPVGYRPNRLAYIMVHMTSSNNSSHIDVEPNGICTWWGTSFNTGAPRGHQMWFTNDPLQN